MDKQLKVREIKVNIQSEFVLNLVTFLMREENFVFVGNESEIWLENLNHPRVQLIYINDHEQFTEQRAYYISQKAQIVAGQFKKNFLMPKVNFLVLNICDSNGMEVEDNQRHALTINLQDATSAVSNLTLQELFPKIVNADLTVSTETIVNRLKTETETLANREVALANLRTKPVVTYVFLLLNLMFFVFLWWRMRGMPTGLSGFFLITYGSTYNPLIVSGEYWRLLTSSFMHIDIWHIAMNALFIFRFGAIVETVVGHWRMAVIIVLSGITSALFGFAFSINHSIGASGVAYGLIGVVIFLAFEMRREFMPFLRQFIGPFIGMAIVTSLVIPNIDHWGHLGGAIGGFIIATIVGVKRVKPFLARSALMVVTLVVLWFGLWTRGVNLTENHDFSATNRALVINNFYFGNEERARWLMEQFGISIFDIIDRD